MGIKVEVGGVPISLRPGESFTWALSYGTAPNVSELETDEEVAAQIATAAVGQVGDSNLYTQTRGRQISILFEDDENNRRVEIKRVYVLAANRPGKDYNTRTITLADQRWIWPQIHIERSYNIRKRTGDYRLIGGDRTRIEQKRRQPDWEYRRPTMKPTQERGSLASVRPWTAEDILKDLLEELCGPRGFVIDSPFLFSDSIEGFELNDPGDEALARALAYMPGTQVYVGTDGLVHVGQLYDQTEAEVFAKAGEPIFGDWAVVDRSYQRPRDGFWVLSDREVELRFDYIEEKGSTPYVSPTSGTPSDNKDDDDEGPGREPLWLENVIINPLYNLPKSGGDPNGKDVYTQGEPVPVKQFLEAVSLNGDQRFDADRFDPLLGSAFAIDNELLRKRFLARSDWDLLVQEFATSKQGQISNERMLILYALKEDWRQTYQIRPEWRDKIRSFTNSRAAIINFETATKAPTPVFTQHCRVPSTFGHYSFAKNQEITVPIDDYADDLGTANISPFMVQVIDTDAGLFRIMNREHQKGVVDYSIIGKPEGPVPVADMTNVNSFLRLLDLDPDFKLATILTCLQDTPNDRRRLHHEFVSTQDAFERLGVREQAALGPNVDVYQTAENVWIGWKDSEGTAIREAFFGKLDRRDDDPKNTRRSPYPMDKVGLNNDRIRELSVAAAASALAPLVDTVEGSSTVSLTDIEPTGNLRAVVHSVRIDANNRTSLLTTLVAPGELPAQTIYSLLPEGVRRKVRRLVE